jgi:hypothetical protein
MRGICNWTLIVAWTAQRRGLLITMKCGVKPYFEKEFCRTDAQNKGR